MSTAAKVLSPFYFCCFRCVIMPLTGVIDYVFCIYIWCFIASFGYRRMLVSKQSHCQSTWPKLSFIFMFITARCSLVQNAVLRSHVVCLSVRLSVTLVDCDHIGWNSSEIISPLVSLGRSPSADPKIRGLLQGEHPETLAQSDPPSC